MNERIEKLGEQAREYATTWHPLSNIVLSVNSEKFEQMFAELIVRECMELALSEQFRYARITHRDMAESAVTMSNFRLLIKEHFGVEE